jgi:hypothetical protein
MSRSHRKTPLLQDGGRQKHQDKKLASRKFRHTAKDALEREDYDAMPRKSWETTDPWDICDWKHFHSLEDAMKWFDKYQIDGYLRGETKEDVVKRWKREFHSK